MVDFDIQLQAACVMSHYCSVAIFSVHKYHFFKGRWLPQNPIEVIC